MVYRKFYIKIVEIFYSLVLCQWTILVIVGSFFNFIYVEFEM